MSRMLSLGHTREMSRIPEREDGLNTRMLAARKASGKTQKEVAKEARVSERQYQAYEYGESEPSASTVVRIADALGTDARTLYPPDTDK